MGLGLWRNGIGRALDPALSLEELGFMGPGCLWLPYRFHLVPTHFPKYGGDQQNVEGTSPQPWGGSGKTCLFPHP